MKRETPILRRRVFTVLSVLSLLLCVATIALWVRSYWRIDRVNHVDDKHRLRRLESVCGHIEFGALGSGRWTPGYSHSSFTNPSYRGLVFGSLRNVQSGSFLGFGYTDVVLESRTLRAVAIPHWSLALLFAILPALHLRAAIRSRRLARAGHCPRCGYDLRATPERCPECGTPKA